MSDTASRCSRRHQVTSRPTRGGGGPGGQVWSSETAPVEVEGTARRGETPTNVDTNNHRPGPRDRQTARRMSSDGGRVRRAPDRGDLLSNRPPLLYATGHLRARHCLPARRLYSVAVVCRVRPSSVSGQQPLVILSAGGCRCWRPEAAGLRRLISKQTVIICYSLLLVI